MNATVKPWWARTEAPGPWFKVGGDEVRLLRDGVEAFPIEGFDETIYWLPEPRALVPGDLLIGDGEGGIRMCPESWLRGYLPEEGARIAELRAALLPLLELPVEHVLASHWSPVIGGGRILVAEGNANDHAKTGRLNLFVPRG